MANSPDSRIDVVAEEQAALAARGPGEDRADELATEEMAQLAHRERCVLERVGITMDEQHDFLARCRAEAARDLALQHRSCLLMRLDRSGGPHEAREGGLDAIGNRRETPKLRRRSELQIKRQRSFAQRALRNQRFQEIPSPNSIVTEPNAIECDRSAL
jgi:hypothetical protein